MTEVYSINEEIVRQTLEVCFRVNSKRDPDKWFICFSNPTAGPWKKIVFPGKDKKDHRIGGYAKKEKRPDLIIFSRNYKLLLIIEAKDCISELLKNSEKIKKTFVKENDKLKELPFIKDEFDDLTVIYGLVFYSDDVGSDYPKIKKEYSDLDNLVSFIVTKDDGNLVIKGKTDIKEDKVNPLKKIIPF